jgi:hypothetical protein
MGRLGGNVDSVALLREVYCGKEEEALECDSAEAGGL